MNIMDAKDFNKYIQELYNDIISTYYDDLLKYMREQAKKGITVIDIFKHSMFDAYRKDGMIFVDKEKFNEGHFSSDDIYVIIKALHKKFIEVGFNVTISKLSNNDYMEKFIIDINASNTMRTVPLLLRSDAMLYNGQKAKEAMHFLLGYMMRQSITNGFSNKVKIDYYYKLDGAVDTKSNNIINNAIRASASDCEISELNICQISSMIIEELKRSGYDICTYTNCIDIEISWGDD